jgi:hypothetical protein
MWTEAVSRSFTKKNGTIYLAHMQMKKCICPSLSVVPACHGKSKDHVKAKSLVYNVAVSALVENWVLSLLIGS